jgi:TPR repeat protein
MMDALNGDSAAMYDMGRAYEQGRGVPINYEKAMTQ